MISSAFILLPLLDVISASLALSNDSHIVSSRQGNNGLKKEAVMTLEDLGKRVKALEDPEAIKKLHQTYINLMDNLEYEKVLDFFTEDGSAEVRNSGVKQGRKELTQVYIEGLAKRRGKERFDGHTAIEPDITVEGDTARGTWLVYMLFSKPTIEWVQGRNECEYRKENRVWKIKSLKFTRTPASQPELYP
jgi:ketosteroid isomerase-like protein